MHARKCGQQSRGVRLLARQSESNICNLSDAGRRRIYIPTCSSSDAELTPGSTRCTWWSHSPPPLSTCFVGPKKQGPLAVRPTCCCEVRRILSLAEMSFGWAGRPLGSLRDDSPDGYKTETHTWEGASLAPVRRAGSILRVPRLSVRIASRCRRLGGKKWMELSTDLYIYPYSYGSRIKKASINDKAYSLSLLNSQKSRGFPRQANDSDLPTSLYRSTGPPPLTSIIKLMYYF